MRARKPRVFLLAAGLVGLACAPAEDPPNVNVIVIVLDTVRADAIDAYGLPWSVSPTLGALAAGGVQWRECVAQSPWTAPSTGSILTGEYPSTHGATAFGRPLDEAIPTMAQHFQAAGYHTSGAVSSWLLGPNAGFDAGFDRFKVLRRVPGRRETSPAITDFGIGQLESSEGPFFLFLHYYDAHFPYLQHEMSRLTPYDGSIGRMRSIWGIRDRVHDVVPEDGRHLRELYQGEVAFIDRELRRLLRSLEKLGLRDNTLVVITSDHGEEFFEHGWLGHTVNLHDTLVRVPLIFHYPKRLAPEVRDDIATQIDILPTVLELAGLPPVAGPGRELFASGPSGFRSIFSEVEFQDPRRQGKRTDQRSIRKGRWKAIENLLSDEWYLFNLATDPRETIDRAADDDSVLTALRAELVRWGERVPRATHAAGSISEEEEESLRALGYVK